MRSILSVRVLRRNRDTFTCACCGRVWPWRELAAFDRALKFCEPCIRMMLALGVSR